jgi:carbon storage regulator CsrA
MLVLSRKVNEKLLFPGINASIEVVSVRGGLVRLGIEAPPGVAVLREELQARAGACPAGVPSPLPRELAHQLRNRLNAVRIGLAVLRRQQAMGLAEDAGATLGKVEEEIEALRQHLDGLAGREPPRPAAPARKRKALLVEDDQNERELLAGFLRLAGLEVDTAGDGLDALDHLRGQVPPDVVLLDMGLPRCDGAATVREIRRDPAYAGLKIIAVTGRAPEEFSAEGGAGINRWFRKPVNPEELLRELGRELGVA